jgi:hypothetical protein
VATNTPAGTAWQFMDTVSTGVAGKFYRVREVVP